MNLKARLTHRPYLLELFIIVNLAFLTIDIYSAHMVNDFGHWAEWIPFVFSCVSPIILLPVVWSGNPRGRWSGPAGMVMGFMAILVGVAGFFYHLESQFFAEMTIASLVYTAPFVAPLAYTGIGFLLLLNRMQTHVSEEWGIWVVILAGGGFLGNFILAVCDHAQNGFFHQGEWYPVFASALAVSFLFVLCVRHRDQGFAVICLWLMLVQALIGMLGFYYHFSANLEGTSRSIRENFIYGAPTFAPLLFINLALLAALGIFDLKVKATKD